ncbi:MAG TPA: malonyl-CoA synthase [Steroidobacter sp.]|nr:malonyl-CoA synthase [Steroidobacter sp.]
MSTSLPAQGAPSEWLFTIARCDPQRVFMSTSRGRVITYGEFANKTAQVAAALRTRGVAAGERIVAQIDKSPEAIALYLACLATGAVFVPLNTAYTLKELEYFLGDAGPVLAVVRPQEAERVRAIAGACGVETMDAAGETSLVAPPEPAEPLGAAHAPSGLAALLYTSGTTGRAKGAMLTRGNLSSNALTLAQAWRFTASDVLLHALPIFHVHGLFVAINTVLAAGASLLFLPKFDADEVIRMLPKATVMMGVPTFYTRLLQHSGLTREQTQHVRLFISGSAPLLPETHREFQTRAGHAILERYGMSETLMNTSNPYDGERIAGSVGPPLPGVQLRITDPESGEPLTTPKSIGMIEIRGPNVFCGYWLMPEKTAAEFRQDGFFVTGDLGRIDERGYVHIVGRSKDLIITGGYNVYPIEIETEIDALPGVVESAVIGAPHPDLGEGVTAIVVTQSAANLTEASIRAALQGRLAKFKLPKRILFAADLPRNAMGKVQKNVLRETHRDLYSCAE